MAAPHLGHVAGGRASLFKASPAAPSDPTVMHARLGRHWKRAFAAKPTDDRLYEALTRLFGLCVTVASVPVTPETAHETLSRARAATPGPDSIPAAAWASAGLGAARALTLLYHHIAAGGRPPGSFNATTLVCVPKHTTPADSSGAKHTPGSTRPLGLKSTDVA